MKTLLLLFFLGITLSGPKVTAERYKLKSWKGLMYRNLPVVLCDRDHYFSSCFKVSEKACMKATTRATKRCLASVHGHQTVDTSANGIKLGKKIGSCVGNKLETKWKQRKSKEKKCYEAYRWL